VSYLGELLCKRTYPVSACTLLPADLITGAYASFHDKALASIEK